jgi:fatty-acyl-CoA synthase
MHIPLTPVRCLYRAVDLYPNKEGVICGPNRFTYAQFGSRCERLASGLIAEGIETGDRVAFLSFNTHKLLEGYYGVVQARGVVMPLNVRLTPAELIQILNHSGARLLLFEPDFAPLVEQIRKVCRGISRYIGLDGPNPQADLTYEDLLNNGREERTNIMRIDETAPAELFYTSGSTGTPKGVALSHRTLYLHALGVGLSDYIPDTGVDLHTVPLFHANGWGQPQVCTMLGRKQVMVRRFDPATVFRLIQEERATSMILVPVMAGALLMSPERGNYDLSSLEKIFLGGAASSPDLIDKLEKAFHCEARAGYGLTETAPVASGARKKGTVTYRDQTDRLRHQAAAGWPLPGAEIRVVDTELRDVPRDEETIGEVIIRGDLVMDGYYRESAATEAVMSGAWLHTGDMAVWDPENYIYIVDRKKDIIISGGENISSIEVECAIAAHPAVMECAVVAAPDPKWGEIPVAFVVPKPGETVTEAQLTAFLDGRLGKFKWPRAWHILSDPLPRTGTGKVLKRELREPFWIDKTTRVQG